MQKSEKSKGRKRTATGSFIACPSFGNGTFGLLVSFGTIVALAGLATGRSSQMMRYHHKLMAGKTTLKDWMKKNAETFESNQLNALLNDAITTLIFDNCQWKKRLKFQRGGRSAIMYHATMTAMVKRRQVLWSEGDILAYRHGETAPKFKILTSLPEDYGHYRVHYSIKSLQDCKVPLNNGSETTKLAKDAEASITLPVDGWRLAESNDLVAHPPLIYTLDQDTPAPRGLKRLNVTTKEYYGRVGAAASCKFIDSIVADDGDAKLGITSRTNMLTQVEAEAKASWVASNDTKAIEGEWHRLVATWNPHLGKVDRWAPLKLSAHTETRSDGLRDYLRERFIIMGLVVEDEGGRLQLSDRAKDMTVWTYGDWKTIEGVLKYMRELYEHALLDGSFAQDEKALLGACERLKPLHGDWHYGPMHILDAIYRLAWPFLCVCRDVLGMKRVTSDPIKSGISDATELLRVASTALKILFFKRFVAEGVGAVDLQSMLANDNSESAFEKKMAFGKKFKQFVEEQCDCETDAVLQFVANFVVHSDLLFTHTDSAKMDDATSSYEVLIETMPIQILAGKDKMVDLGFNCMEQVSSMTPAEREEMTINSTVRMNQWKGLHPARRSC